VVAQVFTNVGDLAVSGNERQSGGWIPEVIGLESSNTLPIGRDVWCQRLSLALVLRFSWGDVCCVSWSVCQPSRTAYHVNLSFGVMMRRKHPN